MISAVLYASLIPVLDSVSFHFVHIFIHVIKCNLDVSSVQKRGVFHPQK